MAQPRIDHYEAVRGPGDKPGTSLNDSIQQGTVGGVSCLIFLLWPGDVQSWDMGNVGPNGKASERGEISLDVAPSAQKGKGPYTIREGMLQTYDFYLRFKAGFPPHNSAAHEWAMLWQAHPQDDNPSHFGGFTGVSVHDGQVTLGTPGADSYFAKEPIITEQWMHRRLVVKWSGGSDGFVKWIDRASGKPIGRFNGATIAHNEFKYLKQGYYRAGGLPEATVYSTLMDIIDGDLSAEIDIDTARKLQARLTQQLADATATNDQLGAVLAG